MLPLAHVEHWAWVFYVLPVVIVIVGITRSTWDERRRKRVAAEQGRKAMKSKKRRSR